MDEFKIKVRLDDMGISNITVCAYPTLRKKETKLYIYAPTGLLRKTDKIRLARYTSTNNRWGNKNIHRVYSGWIRPKYHGDLGKELVYMGLELDEHISNAYTECWKLYISDKRTKYYNIAEALFMRMTDTAYYKDTLDKININSETFDTNNIAFLTDFFGKKLGVCVERNGVQITDYLPFSCTLALQREKESTNKLYIKAPSLSIFHHPKDLVSFRKYMKLKNNENKQQ